MKRCFTLVQELTDKWPETPPVCGWGVCELHAGKVQPETEGGGSKQPAHLLSLTADAAQNYIGGWWCDSCQLLKLPTTSRLHCESCGTADPDDSGYDVCAQCWKADHDAKQSSSSVSSKKASAAAAEAAPAPAPTVAAHPATALSSGATADTVQSKDVEEDLEEDLEATRAVRLRVVKAEIEKELARDPALTLGQHLPLVPGVSEGGWFVTLLHEAAVSGNAELIKFILQRGKCR